VEDLVQEPQISFTGNIGFDPVLRYTPNGVAVVDLRVGTTRRFQAGEEWQDGETLWFDVSCWKQLAENVAGSLKKGDRVTVNGKLLQRSWTREDGTVSSRLVVDASFVGADLGRFPLKVLRPVRDGSSAELLPHRWVDTTTGEVHEPAETAAEPAAQQEHAA
jgi:single-strand DNA-binding protein